MARFRVFCHKFWTWYNHLCAQPGQVANGENRRAKFILSGVVYLLSGLLAVVVFYDSITYDQNLTEFESLPGMVAFPDTIFCPRPGFAVYPFPVKPPPEIQENDPLFRFIEPMDGVYQRAKKHENYDFHVWYNVAVLDLINMTRADVNRVTRLYRNADHGASLPFDLMFYMQRLRDLVSPNWQRDLQVADSSSDRSLDWRTVDSLLYRNWSLPIHPHLQRLLFDASQSSNLTLLWWAIIEPRYVLQYDVLSSDFERKTGGWYNRRFLCYGSSINCYDGQYTMWLDNHLCVMWRRANRPEPYFEDGDPIITGYRFVDVPDELKVWRGNIDVEQIRLQDFISAPADEHGWLVVPEGVDDWEGTLISEMMIAVNLIKNEPVEVMCQREVKYDENLPETLKLLCGREKITDYWIYSHGGTYGEKKIFIVDLYPRPKRIRDLPTNDVWGSAGYLGNVAAMFTGLSVMQIGMTAVHKAFNRTNARRAQLCITVLMCIPMIIWITTSVQTKFTDRYRERPLILNRYQITVPETIIGSARPIEHMVLNHTKLAENNVSVQLLQYMCIGATSRNCYNDLQDQESFVNSVPNFWTKPYHLEFSLKRLRPDLSQSGELHQQYLRLAQKIGINDQQPFDVLSFFYLDPCQIVIGCGFDDIIDHECCKNWYWRPYVDFGMWFSLQQRFSQPLLFSGRVYSVLLDDSVFEQTDGKSPYLGPSVNISAIDQYEWPNFGEVMITFKFPNSTNENGGLYLDSIKGQRVTTRLGFEAKYKLMKDPPICDINTVCVNPYANRTRMREVIIDKVCNCSLCYNHLTVSTSIGCCTIDQLTQCVLQDMFYSSSRHVRKLKNIDTSWPNLTLDASEPLNVFLDGYSNSLKEIFQDDEDSPFHGILTNGDMAHCRSVCDDGVYVITEQTLEIVKTNDQYYPYTRLDYQASAETNIGTIEYDTFQVIEMISLSWGIVSLISGLTIISVFEIILTLKTKLFTDDINIRNFFNRGLFGLMIDNEEQAAPSLNQPATDEAPPTTLVLVAIEIILCILAATSISYMVAGTREDEDHIFNARSISMISDFNASVQWPNLMLCTSQDIDVLQANVVVNEMNCVKETQASVSCVDMFPILRQHAGFACLLTAHPPRAHIIDRHIPIYKVSMPNSMFDHVWIGDVRQLFAETSLTSLEGSTDIKFATTEVMKTDCAQLIAMEAIESCDVTSPTQTQCALTSSTPMQYSVQTQNTSCQYVDFQRDFSQQQVENAMEQNRWTVTVRPSGHISFRVTDKPRYSTSQQVVIIGSVFDSLLSVCFVNIMFYLLWTCCVKRVTSVAVVPVNQMNMIQVKPVNA